MISLSDITNQYGTYSGNSLRGELGSIGSVQNDGLEGINGVNYPYLSELIVKINGAAYTYSGYLNSLKLLGNPYISKSTIPTVDVTLASVTRQESDVIVHGSTTRTKYAEVGITNKLNTVNDVLRYLNDFFNPNTTDTVLAPQSIGSFRIFTTSYSADLDVSGLYPGLEFETYEDIASATSVTISTPPTITEVKQPEPAVDVKAAAPKPIPVTKAPAPPGPKVDSDFLLNDSVDDTRQILSTSNGLQITGLQDRYDTGDYGPMQSILDNLAAGEGFGITSGNYVGSSNNFMGRSGIGIQTAFTQADRNRILRGY